MNTTIDLSVILVSHNTKGLILQAVESVYNTVKTHSFEVIVVENGSDDGSAAAILKKFPMARVVYTQQLVGFSEANNIGRAVAHGKFLFFLNPDTEVLENAVDVLIDRMTATGLHVASGQLLNSDLSIQPQGGALPNLLNVKMWMFFVDDLPLVNRIFSSYQQRRLSYFQKEQHNVGWIGGTAFMILARVFDEVGGWDSKIFLYAEDVDLCMRLHKHKHKIALFPQAKIVHKRHGSVGGSKASFVGEIEGLVYIWKKQFPAWQLPFLRLILLSGSWLRVILFGILLGDENRKSAYLEAQQRARLA